MKIIDSGHEYLLESIDGGEPINLTFVKREGDGYPFNVCHHPGTNVQEVLRALIERTEYMNRQIPCAESEAAASLLKTVLFLFESRAATRHGRDLKLASLQELCSAQPCDVCGHIECHGHHDNKQ